MTVSDRDRDYFRRLGEWKAESHDQAAVHHAALPLHERLQRSWELYLRHRSSMRLDLREDDPSPFYERARRLGMIKD